MHRQGLVLQFLRSSTGHLTLAECVESVKSGGIFTSTARNVALRVGVCRALAGLAAPPWESRSDSCWSSTAGASLVTLLMTGQGGRKGFLLP